MQEQQAYISKAQEQKTDIRNRIALLLGEILSDKHGCKVSLRFENKKERNP